MSIRRLTAALVLSVSLLGLAAAPAAALPSFGVEVRNDANEIQEVTLSDATSGQFRLNLGSGGPGVSQTADIAVGASPATVEAALNVLTNVSAGGGSVVVSKNLQTFRVTFNGGALEHTDVPQLTASPGTTPLNPGGRILITTLRDPVVNHSDERIIYAVDVDNTGADPTLGQVTLELELPGGEQTYAYKVEGSGWGSCVKQPPAGGEPAKATCTRADSLSPGDSYSTLTVVAALGADAPDLAVATATVSGGGTIGVAGASDEIALGPFLDFGFRTFDASIQDPAGGNYTRAGGHPFLAKANFSFAKKRNLFRGSGLGSSLEYVPIGHSKHVIVDTPRGFTGNARAIKELCPSIDDVIGPIPGFSSCPLGSMVGGIDLRLSDIAIIGAPIFAIEPEYGTVAQFAFKDPLNNVYTFAPRLRADDGYAISFESAPTPSVDLLAATPELCGFGAKRKIGSLGEAFAGCKKADDPDANPLPLITNPTRCAGNAPVATIRSDAWEEPGALKPDGTPDLSDPLWKSRDFANPPVTECENVDFEPQISLQPSTQQADSASGLDVELTMPTAGLEDPEGVAQANLKRTRIFFPEEMAVNATAGDGLGACAASQVKLGTNDPISCPDSAKIGTVEIETPLIEETLKGSVYVARQGDVGGALIGLYLVFESKRDGLLIKVPGRVDPNPSTGQLVATVDDIPEAPFSAVHMHFPQGPRSPLLTPAKCGTYQIKTELSPWTAKDPDNPTAAEIVTGTSSFTVGAGPGGGPCPSGALGAQLRAGTKDPVAGHTSPFTMRLWRDDGSRRFSALDLRLPAGLSAYLKGIPYCPNAVLASISAAPGTGLGEREHPSCPAQSRLGTVSAAAGAGASPFFLDTGRAYLAGPYKGEPLSIAVVAPAVAGPLDLGSVVVRNAVHLDPETAAASVLSDPIPTILHGIKPNVREIRVAVDRPGFTLNPTGCAPKSIGVDVRGEGGGSISLARHFQAYDCDKLDFGPKLTTRLFGPTKRGGHPKLRGVLSAGEGEANISRAAVTIPRSEFLDQAHIRTICTRVQFAAKACPKGAIYGHATATTPLLDYPVEGPVYLRSSDNQLPDLVVALKGPEHQPIEAVVVGRVDSVKGQIRTTFEAAPDVPVSKFVLTMQGGKKGLLVNSRDICAGRFRATVKMEGHNGMTHDSRPLLKNGKCAQERKAKRAARRHQKRRRG